SPAPQSRQRLDDPRIELEVLKVQRRKASTLAKLRNREDAVTIEEDRFCRPRELPGHRSPLRFDLLQGRVRDQTVPDDPLEPLRQRRNPAWTDLRNYDHDVAVHCRVPRRATDDSHHSSAALLRQVDCLDQVGADISRSVATTNR